MQNPPPRARLFHRCALAAVLIPYAISFGLPVTDADGPQVMYGYQAFFWAAISVVYLPMWAANPLLWCGCLFLNEGESRTAFRCGIWAMLLGISEVWLWDDRPEAGYFVWWGSMAVLALLAYRRRTS